MAPATHDAVTASTSESDEVEKNKATSQDKETETDEIKELPPTIPEISDIVDSEETAEIPRRYLPRSVSECEDNDRESQRSILRNPNLSKIRPMLEKRQSFDLQLERTIPDNSNEDRAYVTLLQQESAYKGSTFYKADDPENNYKWTFGSAFFFSMNVYTTTGYGSIAPESIAGKSCVMVYGLLFVPLTLVVLRDLGQWALVHTTKIYARLLIMFRRARGHEETKDDELINLPIKFCMGIMLCKSNLIL
ncbi:unnamed protein product [Cylicostephanus goldi]|uniref:Potassium channel domain-containing protein n=1 Tax=Cylicostephanus goldi TaxID=71465 RepID=A0A3P7ME14_CYLGO|nr:unnamed protein product [Cylicostephanus goldi]